MNQFISNLFYKQLTQVISHSKYIDARVAPTQLIKELASAKQRKKLIEYIREVDNEAINLRILSVIGNLILYSDDFYQLIQDHLVQIHNADTWIKISICNPFITWIRKCCETSHFFKQIKDMKFDSSTFMDRLPYIINVLSQIISIVKEIPRFGRYFNLEENTVYLMFCQMIMVMVNMVYSHFKRSLELFLHKESETKVYEHSEILKWVFNQVLLQTNQILIAVTNNKHFKFYKKGIATKTLKIQQCNKRIQNIIGNILDQSNKSKSTALESLQSQIFPSDGSFNEDLFLSTLEGTFKSDEICEITSIFNKSSPQIKMKGVTLKQYRLSK